MANIVNQAKARVKADLIGTILAGLTILFLILSLAFYKAAIVKNFSVAFPIISVLAILVYLAGIFFDLKGVDTVFGTVCACFLFAWFFIARIESLRYLQVNLSDINRYFYFDLVFLILTVVSSIATLVVKKK
jgi:antibiotic biosynthesis monooxygenase (ABM) superfamily enzyme